MGSTSPRPAINDTLRRALSISTKVSHQLLALELCPRNRALQTAGAVCTNEHLAPEVLALIVAILVDQPDISLWISLTKHRDMTDMTDMVFSEVTSYRMGGFGTMIQAQMKALGQGALLDLIVATGGQLRTVLMCGYHGTRDFPMDDLLAAADGDPELAEEVTALLASGSRLGPATAALLIETGATDGDQSRFAAGFHLEDADAIGVLATPYTTRFLRASMESTMTFPVSAAQAATICAIKDAPVRRRVLNLVNLADHLSDEHLTDYAVRARGLTTAGAAHLMEHHGHRLNAAGLPVVLGKLSTANLVKALSGPRTEALFNAAVAIGGIELVLANWVTFERNNASLVSIADKPLLLDLVCHDLNALDRVLTGAYAGGVIEHLHQLELRAHLVGIVEARLGSSAAVWAALAALMPSTDVTTLPELLELAATLLSTPVAH